jgi:hypothetical protein
MRDTHRSEIEVPRVPRVPEVLEVLEVQMKFNSKGLIVTAAGLLLIWTVLETRTVEAFDNAFSIALGVFLVVSSIAIVVARLRGRDVFGQAGALREIQRWFTRGSNR